MENIVNKAPCLENKVIPISGPFDVCLDCARRGKGCSGPRTTAMDPERYTVFMLELFARWGGTRQQLANAASVSKSTIDDFFAGRRKDISRITAGRLEDVLFGGDAKWPCALLLDSEKEIVYEDRPETLEALNRAAEQLKDKDVQISNLRKNYEDIKVSGDSELARVREEYIEEIKFLKEQVAFVTSRLKRMDELMERKDNYIDRLAKQVGI